MKAIKHNPAGALIGWLIQGTSRSGFSIFPASTIGKLLIFLISLIAIAGCSTVGSDYKPPDIEKGIQWNERLNNPVITEIKDPTALKNWWTVFQDDQLNRLIQTALDSNLDLKSAYHSLLAARATANVTRAGNDPEFSVSGSSQYVQSGLSSSGEDSINYTTGFDASWEMDLWGTHQRSVEAAVAGLEATRESMRDVLVSLLADVATNYINLRSTQYQLEIAEEDIRLQQALVDIAEKKFQSGLSDASDVKDALTSLEYAKTTVYDLLITRRELTHRLDVLCGKKPGELEAGLKEIRAIPDIPTEIITLMPADMIRRRPDIRQAERNLAAQVAKIGVAEGDKYPKFTLTGSLGLSSDSLGSLLDSSNASLSAGPSLSWAVFDFGAIENNIVAQTETRNQYLMDYKSAVLTALEEVENALGSFQLAYLKNRQLKKAFELATEAYELALSTYEAGVSDYIDVVSAESSYINYKKQYIQSTADANIDIIALYKAFGGGWESYQPEKENEH